MSNPIENISKQQARRVWIRAQRLDSLESFGQGAIATQAAIEHLGYVQIDTINVIERCHHHILFNRIPTYRRQDLHQCQSRDKSVFEYWTHALSYVPTRDYRFFIADMKRTALHPSSWFQSVKKEDYNRVLRLIRTEGALSIRDIEDDVLQEKDHPWASRKPSKKALQLGFYTGRLTISERLGMLKKYDLTERHFNWDKKPRAASVNECYEYLLDRALRSQGLVSLDSICHLAANKKAEVFRRIESRVKKSQLVRLRVQGIENLPFWIQPRDLENQVEIDPDRVHLLSPFDPIVIQRKRLKMIFEYEHRFEAYLPPEKRVFGYFGLPVLMGDRIVAVLDLKTDREKARLRMQKWSWVGKSKSAANRARIEEALHSFAMFQLDR